VRFTPARLRQGATALAALAFAAVALSACGSSDDVVSGPASAESGVAEITVANQGKSEGDLQLIRVEGEHSADEVAKAFGGAASGKPFPDWFFAGGGVGSVGPGESATVTQVLEPGTYYAVDTEGQTDPDGLAAIEVTGDSSEEEVEGDATVTASEYQFDAETLPAGKSEIVFENAGAQPHHLIASRLEDGATAEDALRFFKTERGKPPLIEQGTQSTAVIEGGESQTVALDLEPGRYAFYCFITDRQGGPPHAFKGMVSEIEVK
jgi:plastocyanin